MFKWVSDNHRLVLFNDETFQEERSLRLSRAKVIFFLIFVFVLISTFTVSVIIFTPIGYLMPERSNESLRMNIISMNQQIDTLEMEILKRDVFIDNMKNVVYETFEYEDDVEKNRQMKEDDKEEEVPEKSVELKDLIDNVESELELGNLIENNLSKELEFDDMLFFTPLRGIVSDTFAPARNHFGTDIVAPKGQVIKSIQKGTVVVSTWSVDTGHMIGVQHENNVISFYKHNSSLLKKEGDIVKAGEGIAIIGNTGEMTDGPHLHFELWFNGQPINPQKYLTFED